MEISLAAYLIRSGIVLAIIYLLYWFFLRKEKTFRFNRLYLLGSVIVSSIVPFINFSGIFSREVTNNLPGTYVQNYIIPNVKPVQTVSFNPAVTQQTHFNLIEYLPYLYLSVILLLVSRTLLGLVKLCLMYKGGSKIDMGDYSIIYTKENIAPFSFFRLVFINEELLAKDNLSQIIEHEKAHIKQFHSLDMLFINFSTALLWINPFIWLVKRGLKETHEFLADEKVVETGYDTVSYSELLINQAAGENRIEFANHFNKNLITKRLLMLKKMKPGKKALVLTLIIVPLAIVSILLFTSVPQSVKIKPKPFLDGGLYMLGIHYTHDSLMSIKSPTIDETIMQAHIIIFDDAILPETEYDTKNYSYLVCLRADQNTGHITFKIDKIKNPDDWNTVDWKKSNTKTEIKILNFEKVISELPVIPSKDLERLSPGGTHAYLTNKEPAYSVVANINTFVNHLKHWNYEDNIKSPRIDPKLLRTPTAEKMFKIEDEYIEHTPNQLIEWEYKAIFTAKKYLILSKNEKDSEDYDFWISSYTDLKTGKINVEVHKMKKKDQKGWDHIGPDIIVGVLNYQELVNKLPILPDKKLNELRLLNKSKMNTGKWYGAGQTIKIVSLRNNTEYWKTH